VSLLSEEEFWGKVKKYCRDNQPNFHTYRIKGETFALVPAFNDFDGGLIICGEGFLEKLLEEVIV